MSYKKPTVAIIGGGFSGMMTAANLCRKAEGPLTIVIIDPAGKWGRGVAYQPYSELHLLNVMAGKMSAYPGEPDHFVNWILTNDTYQTLTPDLISKTYLPRSLYGSYLDFVWKETLRLKRDEIEIRTIKDTVVDIERNGNSKLLLEKSTPVSADYVVLATGNALPGTPGIRNLKILESQNYFPNPWSSLTIKGLQSRNDILIIGNGLTMVDTVLGLIEAGFSKKIYSISPDGFSILQHRHNGLSYPSLIEELKEPYHLIGLVNLFNKHRKAIRKLGLSAEPVIDSMRPLTQKIWMSLPVKEKNEFMTRLRHLWGVARHRLPIHIHDRIQRLKLDGRLLVRAGKIQEIAETSEGIQVEFFNKKTKASERILVERVINCTGPEPDISKGNILLLKILHKKGVMVVDPLKQGVLADAQSFQVVDSSGEKVESLFVIGNLLKGLLWESTAVPEIRSQADKIAMQISNKIEILQKSVATHP